MDRAESAWRPRSGPELKWEWVVQIHTYSGVPNLTLLRRFLPAQVNSHLSISQLRNRNLQHCLTYHCTHATHTFFPSKRPEPPNQIHPSASPSPPCSRSGARPRLFRAHGPPFSSERFPIDTSAPRPNASSADPSSRWRPSSPPVLPDPQFRADGATLQVVRPRGGKVQAASRGKVG